MKPFLLIRSLGVIGAASFLIIPTVQANDTTSPVPSGTTTKLRDFKRPVTTVKEWLAQVEAATVTVTGVTLERTEAGLDITLETTDGKPLQVDATKFRAAGNSLIADIPNAVLSLTEGQAFSADNPTEEIANVQVTQVDTSNIRVAVAGKNALPKQEVTLKTAGLAYSLNAEGETPEEELVVTGEGQRGYRVPNSSTATKTDTPLRDIPQSIQIIPQEVLRDQQATVYEALRNVAGIRQNNPAGFPNVRLTNRGFFINDFSGNTLRNGIKDVGATTGAELSGIERIEVLQGPASVLLGGAAPGGTINFVTKQPLPNPYYSVEANVGSYDFYRGAVDLTGPVDADKKVLYRFNASYKDQGFAQDFTRSRVLVIAPVVSFEIGKNTKLTLEADYVDSKFDQIDLGLPLIGTVLDNPNGKIPRNRNTNEGVHTDSGFRVGYALEHKFSDNWSLKNAFRFGNMDFKNRGVTVGTRLLPDNRTLQRSFSEFSYLLYDEYNLTTDVVGKFSIGSIKHQLLVGVELRRVDLDTQNINRVGRSIDLFNPIYDQLPGAITSRNNTNTLTDQLGIYLQDQVTIAENLKLLLGARFDAFKQNNQDFIANTETSQSGDSFSPRVGIVYQPVQPVSLYASYSRSFNPVIGTAFDRSTFEPEKGTQYEVGVKADLSNRLSATLAFYDLTRSNVVTTDTRPGIPLGFSIQTGEQRSQGIELNIAGEILPGWNIFASYAYTDLRVTEDNVLPIGSSLNGVAKNAASVWTTYEVQKGNLQGLGFGLGLFYVGDRSGFLDDTYELPGYVTTDAVIYYKRDRFRAALNFKNLFNVDYFENSFGRLRVSYGAPFTVQGTISVQF